MVRIVAKSEIIVGSFLGENWNVFVKLRENFYLLSNTLLSKLSLFKSIYEETYFEFVF